MSGRDQKGASGWQSLPRYPSSPQLVKSPILSLLPSDSTLSPPFFPYRSGSFSSPHPRPSSQPPPWLPSLQSPTSVHPHSALSLACSMLFHGSPALQGQSLDPGPTIKGSVWPGPTHLPTSNHTCCSSNSELRAVPQARHTIITSEALPGTPFLPALPVSAHMSPLWGNISEHLSLGFRTVLGY